MAAIRGILFSAGALALFCTLLTVAIAQTPTGTPPADSGAGSHAAQMAADSYPYAGKPDFLLDGKVLTVDSDRDLITLLGDDGTTYTVDTLGTQITLRTTERPGDTDDLTRDMRVHISGTLLSGNLIAANSLLILPVPTAAVSLRPTTPSPRVQPLIFTISLRGTVTAVNNDADSFDVRVSSHQRTVFVSDDTAFPNIFVADNKVPVRPGDRVTVDGKLAADGTVTASTVRMVRALSVLHELIGRVTEPSSPFYTRDILIKLDCGVAVKVKSPSGITILRDNEPISVHDLSTDDVIRAEGSFSGDTFVATRIDVLHPDDANG